MENDALGIDIVAGYESETLREIESDNDSDGDEERELSGVGE